MKQLKVPMKKSYVTTLAITLFFMQQGMAQTYQQTAMGIVFSTSSVQVEVQFFNPQTVRILKWPAGSAFEKKSLSVVGAPQPTSFKITEDKNSITLQSSALTVHADRQTGRVSYFTPAGEQLFTEKDYGIRFTPVTDADSTKTFLVRQAFMLDSAEAIYGLGQHQEGMMNQRLQKLFLRQDNMQICIPFFQSVKGYGVFWDNYSPTTFVDNLQETSFESELGDGADYYFMYGGNADGVVAQMRNLTGQAPLFPQWAYGFWQSRERYKTQYETVGVVQKYRDLKVPLDGIVQDWQYWNTDDAYWNSTEFGNPGFPDPKAMIDSIHRLHAHVIISVWPSFGPKTKIYGEFKQKGMLLDFTTWPPTSGDRPYDAYNPHARDIYWWSYINKNIFQLGMDGWWLDSSEPDHMDVKDKDFDVKTWMGTYRKVVNAYPLMTVGGVSQNQRQTTHDKRVFILTRSAFAGQQRYGATSWSGDVQSRWDVLRKQVSGGLNFSLCALPYWNSDIGGFFSGRYKLGVKDPAFQELYVRWFQFGAFCPMFRSHGTDAPREIYNFGAKGYWAYDAQEKFIHLRYRLLPYIYSTAWNVTTNAATFMRALVMDFAADKKVWNIDNEYLFGTSFLVCPVTTSLYVKHDNGSTRTDFDSVKSQSIYLPAGADWFDFWTGQPVKGGQTLTREVPVDIMPLYVKAGSIVPMGPLLQYAAEKKPTELEIRIYEGANGAFTLYEDENDNYNYEKGVYATIPMQWNDQLKTLTVGERKGSFPGMLQNRVFQIVLVNTHNGTGPAAATTFNKTIKYTGKAVTVKL